MSAKKQHIFCFILFEFFILWQSNEVIPVLELFDPERVDKFNQLARQYREQ